MKVLYDSAAIFFVSYARQAVQKHKRERHTQKENNRPPAITERHRIDPKGRLARLGLLVSVDRLLFEFWSLAQIWQFQLMTHRTVIATNVVCEFYCPRFLLSCYFQVIFFWCVKAVILSQICMRLFLLLLLLLCVCVCVCQVAFERAGGHVPLLSFFLSKRKKMFVFGFVCWGRIILYSITQTWQL